MAYHTLYEIVHNSIMFYSQHIASLFETRLFDLFHIHKLYLLTLQILHVQQGKSYSLDILLFIYFNAVLSYYFSQISSDINETADNLSWSVISCIYE